jgi:alanine racemase
MHVPIRSRDQIVAREPIRPSWCEIDLGAITHNLSRLRALIAPGVSIFVCLKSDAIGCGAVAVAAHAEAAGADGFALGRIDTAIACRRAGVTRPMLLYPTCLPAQAGLLESYDLMPTISTREDVAAWSRAVSGRLKVFLKIDGGGYRVGAFPDDAPAVARAIVESGNLQLAGVYGHPMASYGHDAPGYVTDQIASFMSALTAIARSGIDVGIRMVSSSALLLEHPDADLDAVDPGRLMMGIGFPSIPERRMQWRHAVRAIKSRLVMVKSLDHGGCVPEAPFLPDRQGMRLGLIPLGWSDGYPAKPSKVADVLVRGRRACVVAPIHSELMRIDLTGIPDAAVGDEVVILGRSGDAEIAIEELSELWGLADFEIYMTLAKGLEKIYLNDQSTNGEGKTQCDDC